MRVQMVHVNYMLSPERGEKHSTCEFSMTKTSESNRISNVRDSATLAANHNEKLPSSQEVPRTHDYGEGSGDRAAGAQLSPS